MPRIIFTAPDGTTAWFDPRKATAYAEGTRWDGNNRIGNCSRSEWIDQTLYRTAGGRWILNNDATRYHNGADQYHYLTDDEARDWLIRSESNEEALAEHFGSLPDESPASRGGRPAIGAQVKVAIPDALLANVDEAADAAGLSRSEWIRRAIAAAL